MPSAVGAAVAGGVVVTGGVVEGGTTGAGTATGTGVDGEVVAIGVDEPPPELATNSPPTTAPPAIRSVFGLSRLPVCVGGRQALSHLLNCSCSGAISASRRLISP